MVLMKLECTSLLLTSKKKKKKKKKKLSHKKGFRAFQMAAIVSFISL